MAFTPEQAKEIKEQLFKQVEQMPQENKGEIKEYIKSLDRAGLEEFLKKQNIEFGEEGLKQASGESGTTGGSECIFCSIAKGDIPSFKIAETKKAIAILELNPLSKAHTIVLPIDHAPMDKIPKSAMALAQKIAKRIKIKFKPDDIKIETANFQGHSMINIIPMYKDRKLEKRKAEDAELREVQEKLATKKRGPRISKPKQKPEKKLKEIGISIPR